MQAPPAIVTVTKRMGVLKFMRVQRIGLARSRFWR